MAATADRSYRWRLHPLNAILLAATIPLFLGSLLGDIAYAATYEVQWKNFSSWLIVGGLLFGGLVLLWALFALLQRRKRRGRSIVYCLLLLAMWLLGVINAVVHAKDAWASMPEGLVLSVVVAALAILATGIGFSTLAPEDPR